MSIKCRIWWDKSLGAYVVSSTYSKSTRDFVDALKPMIPSGSRDYDPTTKFWYIQEPYQDIIRIIAEKTFGVGSVSYTSKESTAKQQSYQQATPKQGHSTRVTGSGPTTEDCILSFFNLVSYEAAKKCYLVASLTLHPDKNPSDPQASEKMSKLNELWTRIEKEFFKR